jgi:hypothetical protein
MPTSETVETLRRFIEHAPRDPGHLAPDLLGWWTADGYYVSRGSLCRVASCRAVAKAICRPMPIKPSCKVDQPYGVCVCMREVAHQRETARHIRPRRF